MIIAKPVQPRRRPSTAPIVYLVCSACAVYAFLAAGCAGGNFLQPTGPCTQMD